MKNLAALIALALFAPVLQGAPQTATVNYQGLLKQQGAPMTGLVDLELRLFDAETGGSELLRFDGPDFQGVPVAAGLLQLALPFDPADFDGQARWLEIRVDGQLLQPRQAISSAPYASRALSVVPQAVGVAELQPGAVTASRLAGNSVNSSKIVDGSIQAVDIDSSQIQRRAAAQGPCPSGQALRALNQDGSYDCVESALGAWRLGGNTGTDPALDYLGTADAAALVLGVDGRAGLRLSQGSDEFSIGADTYRFSAPGLLANPEQSLDGGSVGAVVLGGGEISIDQGSGPVTLATGNAVQAPAEAGLPSHFVTVSGGTRNSAAGFAASIGGGFFNGVDGSSARIGGGRLNQAAGDAATVAGGVQNLAQGESSFVGGGFLNQASADGAAVVGGTSNTVSQEHGFVGGGISNQATGIRATIAGGVNNESDGEVSSVGGGESNRAGGRHATVAGGRNGIATGLASSVVGGQDNLAVGEGASALGGIANAANNLHAVTVGGNRNCAGGQRSFAGGFRAKVRPGTGGDSGSCSGLTTANGLAGHFGTFLWADTVNADFVSQGQNRFEVRATGGTRFVSGVDGSGNPSTGVSLAAGSGTWASLSDRQAKADIVAVDAQDVLDRLLAMPVYTWRYVGQDAAHRHLGPMAQDFHAAFGLNGDDDTRIATVDPDGVALAAIQGLNARLHDELNALREANADLAARLATLEQARAEDLARLEKLLGRFAVQASQP